MLQRFETNAERNAQYRPLITSQYTNYEQIRYAQCWEDADVLLAALEVQPNHTCLSIASAGDNTLALLSRNPKRVIAIDLSFAQIACLELRVAAYRCLNHSELLTLIGCSPDLEATSTKLRLSLYQQCRQELSPGVRQFWDDRSAIIQQGIGTAGKFERYLTFFRRYVLPLIHHRSTVLKFLEQQDFQQRQEFYTTRWHTRRWQWLFHLFFSRQVMGWLGRDPHAFNYVEVPVAASILSRTEDVLRRLDPTLNPYLQWIATGHYSSVLPYALRPENFAAIRQNLDRLEWHCLSLEEFLQRSEANTVDYYNLSDVFEWMSPQQYQQVLTHLIRVGRRGGRLVYWNLLVDRHRPESWAGELRSLTELAQTLYQQNQIFFYSKLVIEEIL